MRGIGAYCLYCSAASEIRPFMSALSTACLCQASDEESVVVFCARTVLSPTRVSSNNKTDIWANLIKRVPQPKELPCQNVHSKQTPLTSFIADLFQKSHDFCRSSEVLLLLQREHHLVHRCPKAVSFKETLCQRVFRRDREQDL